MESVDTFIKENNIHFPEGLNFEDNAFIGKAFLRAEVIVILNKVTYLYRKTEVGATQSTSRSKVALSDQAKVIEIVIKDCDLLNGHSRNQDYLELLLNKLRYEAERMALINELPLILLGLPFLTTSISKSKKWSLKR